MKKYLIEDSDIDNIVNSLFIKDKNDKKIVTENKKYTYEQMLTESLISKEEQNYVKNEVRKVANDVIENTKKDPKKYLAKSFTVGAGTGAAAGLATGIVGMAAVSSIISGMKKLFKTKNKKAEEIRESGIKECFKIKDQKIKENCINSVNRLYENLSKKQDDKNN